MTPPRPFWKRKRWIATGVLWLALAYPIGAGPITYLEYRGWFSRDFAMAYRRPLYLVLSHGPKFLHREFLDYLVWWKRLVPREKNAYWIYEWTNEAPP